jgi:hypothetical protein
MTFECDDIEERRYPVVFVCVHVFIQLEVGGPLGEALQSVHG